MAASGRAATSVLADLVSIAKRAVEAGEAEGYAHLTAERIEALRRQGNSADGNDWSRVWVRGGDDTIARIFNCSFAGTVKIGALRGTVDCGSGTMFPSALRNTRLVDSVVMDGAAVHNTDAVVRTVVCDRAAVIGCGIVSAAPAPAPGIAFSNGMTVSVGAEVGGRVLPVTAEMLFEDAVDIAAHRGASREHCAVREAHERAVASYVAAVRCSHAVIGPDARCVRCPAITSSLVGNGAVVTSSTLVDATLCSSAEEPVVVTHSSQVLRSLLQWGAHATTMALVEDSLMCEHSHVERHGKLLGSILGPNSGISEGECASSLVGPFVGFHHQSLLIASFWPEGKGNVGYGANVGSNHTGRAPDQELWPGQGVFFGLGTSIKFPANYRAAQYSVIATGVITLPQTLSMPFSLVNMPSVNVAELSPAINEVMPGWVWLDSAYTLVRNEQKYGARDKARRSHVDHEVLSLPVAAAVRGGRAALRAAEGKAKLRTAGGVPVFTDREARGIGKNFMTEPSRRRGIQAYTQCLRLFALRGAARKARAGVDLAAWATLPGDERWQLEREILVEEVGAHASPDDLAQAHRDAEAEFVDAALRGKAKDDKRGPRTIPDYADTHTVAAEDPVIVNARAAVSKL